MYTNPDHLQQEISPRPFLSPGMKHSTMFSKVGTPGLTFTSKSQASLHLNSYILPKKNQMTKSMIRKQPVDIQHLIREMREKMAVIERTVTDHDREISQIRESKTSSFYSTTQSFSKNESLSSISPDIVKFIKKELEKDDFKLKNSIYSEIDSIKAQLETNYTKKNDLDYMFQRFELNVSNLINNANITRQINELKNKIKNQCEHLHNYFTQEMSNKLKYLHDSNSNYYNQMNHSIENIKLSIESLREQYKPSFITSTQKCYSPKLIKYKQSLQKIPSNSFEKEGEVVVVGQVVYYLDQDGYLLDSGHYYLLDKNSKQIKIDAKQMALLSKHHML